MSVGFIGFQGAGKSKWGALTAKAFNLAHIDTDVLLQKSDKKKRSCRQIYQECGEVSFREKEKQILQRLLGKKQSVISFGGGSSLDYVSKICANRIYLYAPLCYAYESMQLKGGVFLHDSFERFYKRRDACYRTCASTIIDVSKENVWEQICHSLGD